MPKTSSYISMPPRVAVIPTCEGEREIQVCRGPAPIGNRLQKRTGEMPQVPRIVATPEELFEAVSAWNKWLEEEHALAQGKKKRNRR